MTLQSAHGYYLLSEKIFICIELATRVNKTIAQPEVQSLTISSRQIPVQIHYESRGNSRVSITKKGVVIRISRFLNRDEKSRQVAEFKNWASKKLLQRPEMFVAQKKDYYSGKIIALRDKSLLLDLKFLETKTNSFRFVDGILTIKLSTFQSEDQMEKLISQFISECVAKIMHPWVHERLSYLNELHFPNTKFRNLQLKYTHSLWGSCSHEGNISISTRLLLAPNQVIDYVLIHELAHLVVRNHSQKFWSLVAKVLPNYVASEKWLKANGKRCDF